VAFHKAPLMGKLNPCRPMGKVTLINTQVYYAVKRFMIQAPETVFTTLHFLRC